MNLALAILHLFPNADPIRDFLVIDRGEGQTIAVWKLPDPQPTQAELETAWAAVQDVPRKMEIKAEARKRILTRYPEWKQANMTARFTELLDKQLGGQSLTAEETAEKTALLAAWAWVKSVREHSDALEADPNLAPNWPE